MRNALAENFYIYIFFFSYTSAFLVTTEYIREVHGRDAEDDFKNGYERESVCYVLSDRNTGAPLLSPSSSEDRGSRRFSAETVAAKADAQYRDEFWRRNRYDREEETPESARMLGTFSFSLSLCVNVFKTNV